MLTKRFGHASVVLKNETALIYGGYGVLDYSKPWPYWKTTELFDGKQWTRGPDLPLKLFHHCMLLLDNGDIFMAGGYSGEADVFDSFAPPSSATYIYSIDG